MSKWIKHQLGEGVVLTRQASALRDGELQDGAYARMLPGNKTQLYPDRDYSYEALGYTNEYNVVDMHYMTFENGAEHLLVVLTRGFPATFGVVDRFDLNDPQTFDGKLIPNESKGFFFRPDESKLVNRGAEYFLGISGVNVSVDSADPARKKSFNRIYHLDSDGAIAYRDEGFAPTALTVGAQQSLPQLGATLLELPNLDGIFQGLEPEWQTLVERDLYGSNALYLAEFDTAEKRQILRNNFYSVAPSVHEGIIMSRHVPIESVKLSVPGNGYVFAYWATEYDDGFGVESAPSDITSVSNADPVNAVWEVTLDWQSLMLGVTGERTDFTLSGLALVFSREDGFLDPVEQDKRIGALFAVRDQIDAGTFPEKQVITLPLSAAQRAAIQNVIEITGGFANLAADTVRLYRQNLGFFEDFLVSYLRENGGSPTAPDPQGEGLRNAADLSAGRISRQGGLISEFVRADNPLPISYEDYLKDSGVSDPALSYPIVNYVTRGGLGIFDYLRRPDGWSVAANMGQALLRVPWTSDRDSNQISVSPSEAPEQQPLIYTIPVVTEQQDSVKALETLRDHAVVITQGACFRLNYIPFEGSNQADRVLSQISSSHGTRSQRRALPVDTPRGQIVIYLSETSLVATNGTGLFDICPDFSVKAAEDLGYSFDTVILTNNPNEHRLEMWADGVRWDFLYHESQLKDIRGDGYGLVFKLMGPHPWYNDGTAAGTSEVKGAVRAHRPDTGVVMYHIVKDPGGGHRLATSSDNLVDDRLSSVTTRKIWGSDPKSRLRTKVAGVQHDNDVTVIELGTTATPVDETGGTNSVKPIKVDPVDGFSERFIDDGLGSSNTFVLKWKGGAIGPLWTQMSEARSATGR
jgi:hypothetical protein